MTKEKKGTYAAIVFALVLIINPNINIIDIFPDFVGYLILLRVISRAAATAPYFAEAKTYLTRLTWLSVLRLPAFLIMMGIRGENTADSDIIVLLTFVFAVGEVLLMIFAISNLFAGLFYLGERCDASFFISPFKVSKNKTMTPERLRVIAYVFAVSKALLNFLPETLRLTKTVTIGSTQYVRYMSDVYPFVLLAALALSFVIGIVFIVGARGYVRALFPPAHAAQKGVDTMLSDFYEAIDVMYSHNREDTDRRLRLARLFRAIGFLTVGSIFAIEVVFDNFHDINILPHSIYGALITVGVMLIARELDGGKALSRRTLAVGIAFGAASAAAFIAAVNFLSKYTYHDLILGDFVVAEYMPVIIFSAIELVLLLSLLFIAARSNHRFILSHTGILPTDAAYNASDRDYHRSLIARGYILYGIAATSGIAKFVQVLLNFNVEIIFANPNDMDSAAIITTPVPWWGMVVFGTALVYIIFSFIYYSTVKEEIEFKYQG